MNDTATWSHTVRRVVAAALICVLVTAGLLRSHWLPLVILVVLGAVVGLLVATQMHGSRDLVRMPALVGLAVLVLVGMGQLGVVGILLGLALLIVAMPESSDRS